MNEVEKELTRNLFDAAALLEALVDQVGELHHRVLWCEQEIDRLTGRDS